MILFLNGPFSVGKTTTAKILVERIPGSILYDPEVVGSFLRHHVLLDIPRPNDFQDIPFWPRLPVDLAGMIVETYGRSLIIPMTVHDAHRAEVMHQGFAAIDSRLLWVQLTASRETLIARIHAREDVGDDRTRWWNHLDSGLAMASDPIFGHPIPTDDRSPTELADAIVALLPAT